MTLSLSLLQTTFALFSMRAKNTYDTNLIYLALKNDESISQQIKSLVPKSTLATWKKKGVNHLVGKEFSGILAETCDLALQLQKQHQLLKIAKAVFAAYNLQKNILNTLPNLNKLLNDSKNEVLQCYTYIQNFVPKNVGLKLLSINNHFVKYTSLVSCSKSFINKCNWIF